VFVRKLKLSAVSLATLIGFLGCSSPEKPASQELSSGGGSGAMSSGGTGAPGGTPSNGGTGGTGGNPTGGSAGGNPVGGSGGDPITGGSGGDPITGGSGGDPITGGSGGDASGGMGGASGGPTGGVSGNPTGGAGGSPTGGTSGSAGVGPTGTMTIPGKGCTPPAAYANLFVTVSGHTQAESDAKVTAAWNQLFNPSNTNTVYYNGPGADESYVLDTGNNDVRTEGMSYGMMTAVQLGKQTEFDRIWAWVKNHMASGTTGEIAWHCSTNGSKLSQGGAPDGEEYMATALIFAHNRWGDTSGRFNYATEAQWVLNLTRTRYFEPNSHIVRFVSGANYTDGSYVLPAFYQVWACFDTANAAFWNEAVTAAREFFQAAADSGGVIPDHSSFTGQAQGGAGSDAKRCVMNIMMDWNFFAVDPWQTMTYAPAYGNTMRNGGDNSGAQLSCNSLLGFGLPASTGKTFVDRIWSARIPTGTYRYYDGTLYMLGLLHVSGSFKLYY
jgi:oligosaccharide reducing-end xylanase